MKLVKVDVNNPGGFLIYLNQAKEFAYDNTAVVLGAVIDNVAVGIIVMRLYVDKLIIDHMGIMPGKEQKEVAAALIDKAVEIADRKCSGKILYIHMEGQDVLDITWFEQKGFQKEDEANCYEIPLSTFKNGPYRKYAKLCKGVVAFENLSTQQLRLMDAELSRGNVKKGEFTNSNKDNLMDCSFAIVKEHMVVACIILQKSDEGIVIKWLQGHGSQEIIELIGAAFYAVTQKYDDETAIYIAALEESVDQLVQKFAQNQAAKRNVMTYLYKQV